VKSSPPRDARDDLAPASLAARRAYTGLELPHLAGVPVDPATARGNVEGMVGYAQVPLGIAGPLVLRGDAEGSYTVPFATTEGTMVASYQRGMRVIAESGGALVRVMREGYALFPLLTYPGVDEARAAGHWVDAHREALVLAAEATTRHGKVTELDWELLGRCLLLTLRMHTGDAQGANMVNRAAQAVAGAISSATAPARVALHGYDPEKRASTRHWRGRWVVASVRVPASVVAARLRTTSAALAHLWADYQLAYARMGTANHALQVANGLAAIYVATGQDAAYTAESCACSLSLEDDGGELVATLDLPSLHVATVGGGTQKGTAAECQRIIGARSARELACVMAGALLAGDLNLAASFLGDDFAGAHERLGRSRP